jgi:hypothetical protein
MDPNTITLQLNRVEELFSPPAADPFDPASRFISGIDEVFGQLALLKLPEIRQRRLVVSLPGGLVQPGDAERVRAALQRYSQAKIQERQSALDLVKRKGPLSVWYSLIIVAVCLVLGWVVFSLPWLSDTLKSLFGVGINVFAWVALWQPAGIYLYEWIPLGRTIRMYQALAAMPLSLEERPVI